MPSKTGDTNSGTIAALISGLILLILLSTKIAFYWLLRPSPTNETYCLLRYGKYYRRQRESFFFLAEAFSLWFADTHFLHSAELP